MAKQKIYLDNAATTWPKPEEVYHAVWSFMTTIGANPGRSGHICSLNAGRIISGVREKLARLFNCADHPDRIIFALNCTDALNMAIKGVLSPGSHVITSALDHNSVLRPLEGLKRRGLINYDVVLSGPDGELDPADFARAIRPNTRLIALTHASNVIGTITPIEEVAAVGREHGILFLVDAAQTAGVIPIDVEKAGIDLLAFAGHKGLFGPMGTGGLYVRPGLELAAWREGGTGSRSELIVQPDGYPEHLEAGTSNAPGIAGLGAGLNFIQRVGMTAIHNKEKNLLGRLIAGLREIPGVQLCGSKSAENRAAVLSFTISGQKSSDIAGRLDQEYGVMCRPGLACAPVIHQILGTAPDGAVRFSLGYFNTEMEVDLAVKAVREIAVGKNRAFVPINFRQ